MTPEQRNLIPDRLLARDLLGGLSGLIDWLYVRALRMTLLDVETEGNRRGIGRRK
jgi:hypothetical protein